MRNAYGSLGIFTTSWPTTGSWCTVKSVARVYAKYQQLLQQKQNDAMNKWVADLKERLADEIAYAPGFKPAPTTETSTTGGQGGATTG